MGPRPGGCTRSSLSPSLAGTEAAQPDNQSQQAKGQSGWVKVLGSPAGMRSTPSQSSPVLFAFPEGRELRVVSRQPGWVQVTDPGSNQSGWIADTSLWRWTERPRSNSRPALRHNKIPVPRRDG